MEPEDEITRLQNEVVMLREIINRGIKEHCGFFCALPECAKFLSGEENEHPTCP